LSPPPTNHQIHQLYPRASCTRYLIIKSLQFIPIPISK
jgi:hypothetical protein